MANAMNAAPAYRIELSVEESLRTTTYREHRSIANMVAVLIRDCCGRNGATIPKQRALFSDR